MDMTTLTQWWDNFVNNWSGGFTLLNLSEEDIERDLFYQG